MEAICIFLRNMTNNKAPDYSVEFLWVWYIFWSDKLNGPCVAAEFFFKKENKENK